MKNYYFTFKNTDPMHGYWIRVIAYGWKEAREEFWTTFFDCDIDNFYEEDFFKKESCPKGEYAVI